MKKKIYIYIKKKKEKRINSIKNQDKSRKK